MSLLGLPAELIPLISDKLESQKDAFALVLTCRALANILLPCLYHRNIRRGSPAFLKIAKRGLVPAALRFKELGAVIDKRVRKQGNQPLHIAAMNGHVRIVEILLIISGVDCHAGNWEEATALTLAAQNGHVHVVRLLLSVGLDVNQKDMGGRMPLFYAAARAHGDVVRLLLSATAVDPNSVDVFMNSALTEAVNCGHEEVVKMLVADGRVNLQIGDPRRPAPLDFAVNRNRVNIARLLLETKRILIEPAFAYHLLRDAIESKNTDMVKMLLSTMRFHPNTRGPNGGTLLMHAARLGRVRIVGHLLATNMVDPDAACNKNRTPLIHALASPDLRSRSNLRQRDDALSVVKQLLATGRVNPNARDVDGMTPLLHAVRCMFPDAVKVLLDTRRVDMMCKDRHGRTLKMLAEMNADKETMKLLQHAEAWCMAP